ncbi:MAG: polysaccharide deacetylase family protein, partial [Deltaproteobacteria bacterium]|nr:polysaccharide deacetylase family protein [Deltaproteobacteria bacterium]
TPAPHGKPRGVVRRVRLPDGDRRIALTFDLCETSREIAGYDGRIVELLRAQGAKATFFAGGHWMRTHGERTAQLLADPLFELGQHGWSHRNLAVLAGDDLRREIDAATVEAARGRADLLARPCMAGVAVPTLKYFRYPFGDCDDEAQAALSDVGLTAIQWDVAPGDPAPGIGAKAIARAMTDGVRPGSIVVLHANGRGRRTAEALAIAIPELRARGYAFATIGELLAAGEPEIETRCFVSRPGDTLRYRRAR